METRQKVEPKTIWQLDPGHSELTFKVKHLMISHVKGAFQNFDANIEKLGPTFNKARVQATITANSIYTNNRNRDAHLNSTDFFDTKNHPKISFRGTSFEQLDEENYKLTGILGIKGIKKELVLDVDFGGVVTDPHGNKKAGFSLNGKLNRKNWGLDWNTVLKTGGVLVSDEVRINAELQFIQQ